MSKQVDAYRFSVLNRGGDLSTECRACGAQISAVQLCHTIIIRRKYESNNMDFCHDCYEKRIQQFFGTGAFTTSVKQPKLLESLNDLVA